MRVGRSELVCVCVLGLMVCGGVRGDEGERKLGVNAALQYWAGFALMPKLEKGELEMMDNWKALEVDGKARRVVGKYSRSLKYLHRGAEIEVCDWGFDFKLGPLLEMPHLGKARQLARAAALRARIHFKDGQGGEAMKDLSAVMKLGRDIGKDHLLITVLIHYALDAIAIEQIAEGFDRLDGKSARGLLAKMKKLGRPLQMSKAIRGEQVHFIGWLKRTADENDFKKLQKIVGPIGGAGDDEAAAKKAFMKMVEGTDKMYDELRRIYQLPYAKFKKAHEAYVDRIEKSKNVIARTVLPAVSMMRVVETKARIYQLMLVAALRLKVEGKEGFGKVKDPTTGKTFEMKSDRDGFTLRSPFKYRKKAVELRFKRKSVS